MRTLVLILALLVGSGPVLLAAEKIDRFQTDIAVEENGDIVVTETITVTSEQNQIKRGIFRDIPTRYETSTGFARKPFEILSIKRDGKTEPYHTESNQNGIRIYIGSKDVTLPPGQYTYEITYQMGGMLGFFKDHDELYWNATGNYWEFPIEKATATVTLPPEAEIESGEAYTGKKGAQGDDYTFEKVRPNVGQFWTSAPLPPEAGLTIVVTWPKGIIAPPTAAQKFEENKPFFIALASLLGLGIYYALVWLFVGRDPSRGVIIPRYEPPHDFSPGACRYLWKMGWDAKCFTAAIINLAVKGLITIEQKGGSYTLRRTDKPLTQVRPRELEMAQKLFASGESISVQRAHHRKFQSARKALQKGLAKELERHFFVRNSWYWAPGILIAAIPTILVTLQAGAESFLLLWLSIWSIGVFALWSSAITSFRSGNVAAGAGSTLMAIIFTIPWFVVAGILVATLSLMLTLLLIACYLLVGIFYHLMKAPTSQGRKILDEIEGFRQYLAIAEEDRLNLENPPEMTPELFERFLPYALALDVEQQWSEKFSGVLKAAAAEPNRQGYRPMPWYSGRSNPFNNNFGSALGASLGGALATAATSPKSSSGSGGGGSSGGGGGGGGGGGW